MEWTEWWVSQSHWFWIMAFLFMILMVCFAIRCARRAGGSRFGCGCFGRERFDWWEPGQLPMAHRWTETPCQILDRRYADGEITKEQHQQRSCYTTGSST